MLPTILFRCVGADVTYSPTIMQMNGEERPEDFYLMIIEKGHQPQFGAILRGVAQSYRKILSDPTLSASRFDHWMKSKDPLFAPQPTDKRELVVALSFRMMISAGLEKRRERADYLRKIFSSNGAVNEEQLRGLERKLGLQ